MTSMIRWSFWWRSLADVDIRPISLRMLSSVLSTGSIVWKRNQEPEYRSQESVVTEPGGGAVPFFWIPAPGF
jgi:hypothetical protein